ncbi:MAG TPA: DUF6569 family protein [Candidatus Acidoferrum sp.]|nr:DUF6569 family protein [Candidatus Acidoferrum sp.]
MNRILISVLGHGLLGISALGMAALGFLWYSPTGATPPGKQEGEWRLLDPVSYENLTIFPVVSGSGYDTSSFLTLEEGLSSGEVTVREQGADVIYRNRGGSRPAAQNYGGPSVNQLVLVNHSKRPLLLLAGELVSGGKQDRVIGKDRIVAPFAEPLPLNVFCVEHGRWSAGSQFNAAKTIVHPSVREQAAVRQKQGDVWAAVTAGSMAPSVGGAPPRVASSDLEATIRDEAPTQSYSKIYESRRVSSSVEAVVGEIQRRFRKETSGLKGERVVGVVVAYGGEVAWSDIFASDELFNQYWSKLLRSYAVEAVARPTLREKASPDDAREFLRRLNGREQTESEPGVYRWREINEGGLSQIELDALAPKTFTLHRLVLRRTS